LERNVVRDLSREDADPYPLQVYVKRVRSPAGGAVKSKHLNQISANENALMCLSVGLIACHLLKFRCDREEPRREPVTYSAVAAVGPDIRSSCGCYLADQ